MRPEVGALPFEELPGNPEGDISADEEAYERADYTCKQAQDCPRDAGPADEVIESAEASDTAKTAKSGCEKQRCQEGKQPVYKGCHAYTQHEVFAVRFGYLG